MAGRMRKGLGLALSLAALGAFPVVAVAQPVTDAQSQTGTITNNSKGNSGNASQSGNNQSATQSCSNNGPCVNLNQEANCVGSGCQAANVANVIQGAAATTSYTPYYRYYYPQAYAARAYYAPLAYTGMDVGVLYLIGGLLLASGLGLLTAYKRGWLRALRLRRSIV